MDQEAKNIRKSKDIGLPVPVKKTQEYCKSLIDFRYYQAQRNWNH